MNEGLIPRRYAKALYIVSKERGEDKAMYSLMKNLIGCFVSIPELNDTLNNPYISVADKSALIRTACEHGEKADTLLDDFIRLLVDNKRIGFTRLIAYAFVDIYRKENHIYKVDVESAVPLASQETARLKELISRHLKGGIMEYEMSVNPSLIGGFTVRVGNEKVDASVSNELKQLRLNLISK